MIIGICSICQGHVRQHTGPWAGLDPPTPTCVSCGAKPSDEYRPIILMKARRGDRKPAKVDPETAGTFNRVR